MGHCLSCFQSNNNDTENSPQSKKNEVIAVDITNQVPHIISSTCPQDEPLLHNNENTMNNIINSSVQNNGACGVDGSLAENVQKANASVEKTPKTFYQKLPSIQRTVSSLASSEPRFSDTKVHQLFDQYRDSLEDAILAEGIENLCNDLQLNPDDFKVLVLAWKLNASQMCRFTKTEFVQGLKNMKTDSIKGIQQKLNELTSELTRDTEQFKDLYRFTFKFGLDVTIGQRILPVDVAVLLWRLVFTNNEPPLLDRWLSYLEKNAHIRGIPKDTWYMFLNFCEYVRDDLSSYDDTEAWPSLFDDFVEYENDQMNQNVSKSDIKIQD